VPERGGLELRRGRRCLNCHAAPQVRPGRSLELLPGGGTASREEREAQGTPLRAGIRQQLIRLPDQALQPFRRLVRGGVHLPDDAFEVRDRAPELSWRIPGQPLRGRCMIGRGQVRPVRQPLPGLIDLLGRELCTVARQPLPGCLGRLGRAPARLPPAGPGLHQPLVRRLQLGGENRLDGDGVGTHRVRRPEQVRRGGHPQLQPVHRRGSGEHGAGGVLQGSHLPERSQRISGARILGVLQESQRQVGQDRSRSKSGPGRSELCAQAILLLAGEGQQVLHPIGRAVGGSQPRVVLPDRDSEHL
jgi:hypothetical protein